MWSMQHPSDKETSAAAERRIFSTLRIVVTALVVARFLLLMFPVPSVWGLNYLSYLPLNTAVVLGAVPLIPILPGFRRVTTRVIEAQPTIHKRVFYFISSSVGVVMLLFPVSTFFLGDGPHIVFDLFRADNVPIFGTVKTPNWFWRSAPLSGGAMYTVAIAFEWVFDVFGLARPRYPVYIFHTIGLLSYAVVVAGLKFLVEDGLKRLVYMLGILGLGTALFWFGYVEFYALTFATLIIYFLLFERYLEEKAELKHLVIVFILGCLFHLYLLALAPTLIYLLLHRYRPHAKITTSPGFQYSLIGGSIVLYIAASFATNLYRSYNYYFMPFVEKYAPQCPLKYYLLSPTHLEDLPNVPLIQAAIPAVSIILLIMFRREMRVLFAQFPERFYLMGIVTFSIFLFFANSLLGLMHDWDIAMPLGVLVTFMFLGSIYQAYPASGARILLPIVIAIMLFNVPWIATNTHAPSSARRQEALLPRYSNVVHCYMVMIGYKTLRNYYASIGATEKQIAAVRNMLRNRPYPGHFMFLIDDAKPLAEENPALYAEQHVWALKRLEENALFFKKTYAFHHLWNDFSTIDSIGGAIAFDAATHGVLERVEPQLNEFTRTTNLRMGLDIASGFRDYRSGDRDSATFHFQSAIDRGFAPAVLQKYMLQPCDAE